jgi:hypothetical protein
VELNKLTCGFLPMVLGKKLNSKPFLIVLTKLPKEKE